MNHDISQPVPQGSDGAQDAENSRIAAIADQLERLCKVHEAQCGNSLQNVSRFETEQRAAEQMAKNQGFWIPMMDVFNLGVPGPSGNENDTYVGEKVIYKVNNLLNSGSIVGLLRVNGESPVHKCHSLFGALNLHFPSCSFFLSQIQSSSLIFKFYCPIFT